MKKLISLIFFSLMLSSCNHLPTSEHEVPPTPREENSVVCYFSRAGENYSVGTVEKGNTEKLAEIFVNELSLSTSFRIETEKSYPASYNECTAIAKQEKENNERPTLKYEIDISGYENIYLGYPIWWSDMPMAVYTFLETNDFESKNIYPFCTHAGSGLASTVTSIKKACPKANVHEGLAVLGFTAQNDQEAAKKAVRDYLSK